MSEQTKPRLIHQLWLRALATVGVAAAVLLSWWWKVDDLRAPDALPVVGFGQPVDMGRTLLTPQALQLHQTAGRLVMTALAENLTGQTQNAIFGAPGRPPEVSVAGQALAAPEILLTRDDGPLGQLQPRLPEQIQLIWQLPAGWVPEEVEISFAKQRFKLEDNLYGQASWLGFTPTARMVAMPEVAP